MVNDSYELKTGHLYTNINPISIPAWHDGNIVKRIRDVWTMTEVSLKAVAFSMPGGEHSPPSQSRPVDLVHLARQTMGDRMLEEEVLQLFMQQASLMGDKIRTANPLERKRLAHGLKGSARGIGAFAVADCAGSIEANPEQSSLINELIDRLDAVRQFIAAINR